MFLNKVAWTRPEDRPHVFHLSTVTPLKMANINSDMLEVM